MTSITLTCEACGGRMALTPPEVEALVAAFQKGNGEPLCCRTCGMSLGSPLHRALNLPMPEAPGASAALLRRRHVRLPFDLPVAYERPVDEKGWGRVRNLSDGGLLLLAREALPPATPLRLQLQTHHQPLVFEGVVVWNDSMAGAGHSSIAHGIRFTSPVPEGLAVELFLSEALRREG